MIFRWGTEVEVRNDDPGFKGSWYEGKITRCMHDKNRYSVRYLTLLDEGGSKPLREVVNGSLIRPRPPPLPEGEPDDLPLRTKVDAFHMDGWWEGFISGKESNNFGGTYMVYFPDSNETLKFERLQLRVHRDWNGREWADACLPVEEENRTGSGVSGAGEMGQDTVATPPPLALVNASNGKSQRSLKWGSLHDEFMSLLHKKNSVKGEKKPSSAEICTPDRVRDEGGSKISTAHRNSKSSKVPRRRVKSVPRKRKKLNAVHESIHEAEIEGDRMGESGLEEQRGQYPSQDEVSQKTVEKAAAAETSSLESSENTNLPFLKKSPVWKVLESDELFNVMPQSPHFHPLKQSPKLLREGLAIGQMVQFINLADATCKLELWDRRFSYESIISAISELEKHGFDAQLLRARIEQLQRFKDQFMQSEFKILQAEGSIRDEGSKKKQIYAKIESIDREIEVLQAKRAAAVLSVEKINGNIEHLVEERQMMIKASLEAKEGFVKLAAAPWLALLPGQ